MLTQALLFISVVRVDPWQMTMLIVVYVLAGGSARESSPRFHAARYSSAWVARCWLPRVHDVRHAGPAPGRRHRARIHTTRVRPRTRGQLRTGALLTLGIGNYAPSLILFGLLGIDPRAAFPIMMGSGAFVAMIPASGSSGGPPALASALGLSTGGIPGVMMAVWLVESLPLGTLRWLVLVVVAYASVALLEPGSEHRLG